MTAPGQAPGKELAVQVLEAKGIQVCQRHVAQAGEGVQADQGLVAIQGLGTDPDPGVWSSHLPR